MEYNPGQYSPDPANSASEYGGELCATETELYKVWQQGSLGGETLEQQKAEFGQIVAWGMDRANESEKAKIEVAEPIIEWHLFGEPQVELPPGLAHVKGYLGREIAPRSKDIEWAVRDSFALLGSDLEELYFKRRNNRADSNFGIVASKVAREQVQRSQAYRTLMALTSVETNLTSEQPLTPGQKLIKAQQIESEHARQAAISASDIGLHPGVRRSVTQAVQRLDHVTQPQAQTEVDTEALALQKTRRFLEGVIKTAFDNGSRAAVNISNVRLDDDRDLLFDVEDSMGKTYQEMMLISTAGNALAKAVANDESTRFLLVYSNFVANCFAETPKPLAEIREEWLYEAGATVFYSTKSVDMRGNFKLNNGHLSLLHAEAMPIGEEVNTTGMAIAAARRAERETVFQDLKKIEDGAKAMTGEVYYPKGYMPARIPRMVISRLPQSMTPGQAEAHYTEPQLLLRHGMSRPSLPGFVRGNENEYGWVQFYREPTEGGYELPPRHEMMLSGLDVEDFYYSLDLYGIASAIRQQRHDLSIVDLENIIWQGSRYYVPENPNEATEMEEAIWERRYSEVVVGGFVLLQCTGADELFSQGLNASGVRSVPVGGSLLPESSGELSGISHSQTKVYINDTPYYFDATPSATFVMQQQKFDWFNRQPSWGMGVPGQGPQRSDQRQAQQAMQSRPTAKASIPEKLSDAEVKQAVAEIKGKARHSILQDLESDLMKLYEIKDVKKLYDHVAKLVPAPKREHDPLWRSLSLARKAAKGQADLEGVKREAQYLNVVQQANAANLKKLKISSKPTDAMFNLLNSYLHQLANTLD